MATIGKAIKHIFSPETSGEVMKSVHSTKLNANVDVNSNTLFGRIFDDTHGLAGTKHAEQAQSRWAARRKDGKDYDEALKKHSEQLTDMRKTLETQQKDGEPANVIKNTETTIEQHMAQRDKIKRQTSFTDAAWGSTKDTFHAMNAGTAGQVAMKWGTATAGYMAVNGVGRALTGGGVTYNASGERDIMGIPLV